MEENKKMCIGLFSGSIDKLTAAGIVMGGAVADDMDVDVYVLLQAARAFRKDIADDYSKLELAENPSYKDQFVKSMEGLNIKPWLQVFRELKDAGNIKFHICGTAGKVWDAYKMEDFVDIADEICGIGGYITDSQNADVHLFI